VPSFDRFIAVDWSGAKGKSYKGIAVAECLKGSEAPTLVAPPGHRWKRSQFVEWLSTYHDPHARILVGIDCSFALPAEMASQLLGDGYSAFDLWSYIDTISLLQGDFCASEFVTHNDHRHLYWHSGTRPPDFVESHRATEKACAHNKLGHPQSTLKLIGSKQVGKASLAGMRVLHALKRRLGNDFAVWPFEPIDGARIVCVEIYPRLFLRMAGHGNGKAAASDISNCLAELGSLPFNGSAALSDHDTDALVSAAGLRAIVDDHDNWQPKTLDSLAIRAEGWIFGVT